MTMLGGVFCLALRVLEDLVNGVRARAGVAVAVEWRRPPAYTPAMARVISIRRLAGLAGGLMACAAVLRAQAPAQGPDAARLNAVVDQYMTAAARTTGGGLGRGVSASRVPVLSLDLMREQATAATAMLESLAGVHPAQLTHDQWITYSDLRFELTLASTADQYYWLMIPVTPYSSPLRSLTTPFETFKIANAADGQTYLDALIQIPALMAAYEAKLRGQAQRGIVLPADEVPLVLPFVRTFLGDPPHSAFSLDASRLSALSTADATALRAEVDDTIRTTVNPSIQRLAAFIDGPYRAKAPRTVGLEQYPGGADYYRYLIRQHTDLDLTAQQIHDIGLAEVTRLEGELDRVRVAAAFTGTLAEFRTYLKTDRRFFARSSDDIGAAMMAAIRRIEPKIDSVFLEKPNAPYGVKRLDESLEQSMTYGYYQIPTPDAPEGLYRFNGSQPESRSVLMAAAIIYHELIPGHHFQLALRQENTTLSPFRRRLMHTAFTEGWGEDASDLAGELGMYDADPYARAGRLAMDLFLSSRLVVDTGMNALGWSRDRAMAFMRDHTLESDVQIGTETLRYSADMPGQALAYKLGSREIHQLRDQVRQAQDAAFDIRQFHAYLLDYGSMPLGTLDEHVACYLHEHHRPAGR